MEKGRITVPLHTLNDKTVKVMRTIKDVNPVQAYFEGMLWAAFGVRIVSDNAAEWQIEAVKKYAKKLKEEEIDHSSLTPAEKEDQKILWKQLIDETTKGFKDVLKREGRMISSSEK